MLNRFFFQPRFHELKNQIQHFFLKNTINFNSKENTFIVLGLLFFGLSWSFLKHKNSFKEILIILIIGPYLLTSFLLQSGLFTDRSIEKEEFIFKAINNDKSITHYGKHINHQKEPNTKLKEENGEYNIYSIKPIKKGEELTTDYDDTPSFISKSNPEWNK